MLLQLFIVTVLTLCTSAIKVDDRSDGITKPMILEEIQNVPIYYASDGANVDSYLVPPDPHNPNVIHDIIATPATYLLPPSPDRQNEYFYKPTEPGEQTDWYPIDAQPQKQTEKIPAPERQTVQGTNSEAEGNLRTGKSFHRGQVINVPVRELLPPQENAPNDFVVLSDSPDFQLPPEELSHILNRPKNIQYPALRPPFKQILPFNVRLNPGTHQIPHFTLPINLPPGHKNTKRLYPKKYQHEFKPVPIPVSQYVSEIGDQVPTAKPVQITLPPVQTQGADDMKTYLFSQSEKKHKLMHKEKPLKEVADPTDDVKEEEIPSEQQASETNYRHPGHHAYPNRLTEEPSDRAKYKPNKNSKGERTEFRMHGMNGPHSYQFGYDTGKGKNRQFRYEERDNDGHVKGHYGYVDKYGKLRVVNYDADPEHGFRAESPVEKE